MTASSGAVPGLFTTEAMAAVFSPEGHVSRLLAFEAALARAEAELGIIPEASARTIEACCDVARFDVAALYRDVGHSGTIVLPLVAALGELAGADAGRFVHWGATSQDAVDSATMMQMREGLDLLLADLSALGAACAALADRHRRTVMAGRTLLQQAVPITFGLKAARWLAMVVRRIDALRHARQTSLALQFGGAAGTLASLGDVGAGVAERLAVDLGLPMPDLPWHAERDRVASVVAELGITAGALAKVAGDVTLLAQTEVGEVGEARGEGRGASSAMPQKRNAVDSVAASAAARMALGSVSVVLNGMAHEHERAAGAWQAEWVAVPEVFRHTAGAVAGVRRAVEGLEVHADRMRRNLELGGGAIMAESLAMALAAKVGRPQSQAMVKIVSQRAVDEGIGFAEAARGDPDLARHFSHEALERALDPAAYLGGADAFIDRALERYRAVCGG